MLDHHQSASAQNQILESHIAIRAEAKGGPHARNAGGTKSWRDGGGERIGPEPYHPRLSFQPDRLRP